MGNTKNSPTEEERKDTTKQRISREEMLKILNGISGKQDTFKGFLDELAQRANSFDDFVEKISIWFELEREKEFFESAMKQARQIEGKITWDTLKDLISGCTPTIQVYFQRRVRSAFSQTKFKRTPLEVIRDMIEYTEFDFGKNLEKNILPGIDNSVKNTPKKPPAKRTPPEIKQPKKIDVSTATTFKSFDEVLEKIAGESSDFNDFLDRVSNWIGIDTELFRRVIDARVALTEKKVNEKSQDIASYTEEERRSLQNVCKRKSKEAGITMGLYKDVVQGCIKKRELFKEVKMQEMREKYLKITGEAKTGKSLSDKEENEIIERLEKISQRAKAPKAGKTEILRIAQDGIQEVSDLQGKGITLSLQLAEELRKVLISKEFNKVNAYIKTFSDVIPIHIYNAQRAVIILWAAAIENEYQQTQDIGRLRELDSMISKEMAQKKPLVLGALKEKIREKIRKIEQRERFKNLSPTIEEVAKMLVTDTEINIQDQMGKIQAEAKSQAEAGKNKRISSLSITQDQAQRVITQNLAVRIGEDSDTFKIKIPPTEVIDRFKKLGIHPILALDAVISNLINREEFMKAENLCITLDRKKEFGAEQIASKRKKVLSAKVASIFLAGMNGERTAKEDQTDYELIYSLVQRKEIDLKDVKLGTKSDGTMITLADIWSDELAVTR